GVHELDERLRRARAVRRVGRGRGGAVAQQRGEPPGERVDAQALDEGVPRQRASEPRFEGAEQVQLLDRVELEPGLVGLERVVVEPALAAQVIGEPGADLRGGRRLARHWTASALRPRQTWMTSSRRWSRNASRQAWRWILPLDVFGME